MKNKATSSYRFISSSKGTIFAFSCMILFMLLLGMYAHFQIQQAHKVTQDLYNHPFMVSNAVREINSHIISMHRSMKDVATAENDAAMLDAIDLVNAHEQEALIYFDIVLDRFLGNKAEIRTIRDFFINWKSIRDEVIELSKKGHQRQAQAITKGKGAEYVTRLEIMATSLIHFATNKADKFYKDSESRMVESAFIATILMLIVILLSLMIAVSVIRFQRDAQKKNKHHLEQLEKSELKYRELLESSPDAVLIVDKNRCIQIVNSQAAIMFGYTADELIGETIERLIPGRYAHQHQVMADDYVGTPDVNPKEQRRLTALKKDGSEFPVSVSLSPVTIGGELFITSDVRDMTEQEEIERNLRQAQKMESIGTLVGGIAHDFNNMLAAITGSVYLAKRDLNAKDNNHLNTVETQCEHAAGIVSQLLAFARRDIVQVEPISIRDLLLDSAQLMRLSATEKIQLHMDICEEKLIIKGDNSQLHQVMLNLVNNARDALAHVEAPIISVTLQRFSADEDFINQHTQLPGKEFARISVSDNGSGIPSEHLEHIFEPFYTTKEVGQGTGLGLAMIDGAIKTHRGTIQVESSTGHGSTFHIYLPLVDAAAKTTIQSDTVTDLQTGHGELILIVDDEESIRNINRQLLESLGYQTIEASDGLQAVAMFKQHQEEIKLVLTDVVMPIMGGVESAHAMRSISPQVPVIFATGYDQSQVLDQEGGIDHPYRVLAKPYSVKQLNRFINELISQENASP